MGTRPKTGPAPHFPLSPQLWADRRGPPRLLPHPTAGRGKGRLRPASASPPFSATRRHRCQSRGPALALRPRATWVPPTGSATPPLVFFLPRANRSTSAAARRAHPAAPSAASRVYKTPSRAPSPPPRLEPLPSFTPPASTRPRTTPPFHRCAPHCRPPPTPPNLVSRG